MARNRRSRIPAPEVCPVCGAEVHRNALACRECGADHHSGWREDADIEDGLDLPDEAFDYDEFTRREFGHSVKPDGMRTLWWIVAVVLLVVSLIAFFGGRAN
jgi:hypothetical protein